VLTAEEVDRQRQLRRPDHHLGPGRETDRVLGFVVEKGTAGFSTVDLEDKIALRRCRTR
jgi:hypothetical protein